MMYKGAIGATYRAVISRLAPAPQEGTFLLFRGLPELCRLRPRLYQEDLDEYPLRSIQPLLVSL